MIFNRLIALAGVLIGLAALALQFSLTIPASLAAGRNIVMSVVFYFSFFTILTNIALVLVYAASLSGGRWFSRLDTPLARASAAAAIALVSGFYHLFLAALWRPEGLFLVCDVALHYITPAIYLIWFVVYGRSGTLRLTNIPAMLAAPLLYLVYVMIRGALIGEYPYPVLDAGELGYLRVGINAVALFLTLTALSAMTIGIDRFKPRPQSSAEAK